ncbi:MAG: HEAT repeat domain-containing protein [Armatimonadota bacterium]
MYTKINVLNINTQGYQMSLSSIQSIQSKIIVLQKQPDELYLLMKTISFTMRLSRLYGSDHPNTAVAITSLMGIIETYIFNLNDKSATCIFSKDSVIVNDHSFENTPESNLIYRKLRARGAMAVTFILGLTEKQIVQFINFLNVDPQIVIAEGGPREYLRKLGVTRIVATEAIYIGDEKEDKNDQQICDGSVYGIVDHAIGAAIDWLSKQNDDSDEEILLLPIIDILSDPDMAAKLIREAVTKLHASRTDISSQQLASEVIDELKDLASTDKKRWDEATPHIRKAISKLPVDIRPVDSGFSRPNNTGNNSCNELHKTVSIDAVETQLADTFMPKSESLLDYRDVQPLDINLLFEVSSEGMLSIWRNELLPSGILQSSGRTYETLMTWQDNASEHGRMADALAMLILKAVEIEDYESALLLVEILIRESERDDGMIWRRSNTIAALESLVPIVLQTVVQKALSSGSYHNKEIASFMVENIPSLALDLVNLLGTYRVESFDNSLKLGLVKAGSSASSSLADILRTGSPTSKISAIETLIDINSPSAMNEVYTALSVQDESIVIRALSLLPKTQSTFALDACANALKHRSLEVRCAAIEALGNINSDSVMPYIIHIINDKHSSFQEKLKAIEVLGTIGKSRDIEYLRKISNHRPLIGRKQYLKINTAALDALNRIQKRLNESVNEASR